jgi:cell division protein FtsQ
MEINTGKDQGEPGRPSVVVPPDTGRPARKKTVQKVQQSRHWTARLLSALRLLGVVLALAVAATAGMYAYRTAYSSELLRLRNVMIAGCKRLDPSVLERIVRQSSPASTLRIDLADLQARLEREPWVRRAEIRRVLPASLSIYVEERAPAAIGEIGSELYLVDGEGVLLDAYHPGYGKLDVPVFSGLRGESPDGYRGLQEDNAARVRLGVQVLAELAAGSTDLTRAISEMDLADMGDVTVLLVDDTAEIHLGNRDFLRRFQGFLSQYAEMKAKYGEMTSVNLRFYPDIVYNPKQAPATKTETGGESRQTVRY